MRISTAPDPDTPPPAIPPGARVPDFFIIGHEKCGTTALFHILRQHPQIFMPDRKEPRFFAPDLRDPALRTTGRLPRTLEEYLSLFAEAGADQRAGEASPQYIRSARAARLIAEIQPQARIIAILREPISFIRAFHLECVRSLVESERDLRKALALEAPRREGRRIPRGSTAPDRLFYREHVRYTDQLRRFEELFGEGRLLVVIYDDFRADNDATVRRVLRFLDVDDEVQLQPWEARRTRKAVRMRRLHRVALAVQRARRGHPNARRLARTVDALTPRAMRSNRVNELFRRIVFTVPPPLDERFMRELRHQIKPEVVALSDHLGRDLVSEWGYANSG
jgi:hypothetical protein